jgi:hypothetical protein
MWPEIAGNIFWSSSLLSWTKKYYRLYPVTCSRRSLTLPTFVYFPTDPTIIIHISLLPRQSPSTSVSIHVETIQKNQRDDEADGRTSGADLGTAAYVWANNLVITYIPFLGKERAKQRVKTHKPSRRRLIPKPKGQVDRSPPNGYNQQDAMGLSDNKKKYNRLAVCMSFIQCFTQILCTELCKNAYGQIPRYK